MAEIPKIGDTRDGLTFAGWRVSCPRIPHGRMMPTLEKARAEARRQMRAGASTSGISEVWVSTHNAEASV